MFNGVELEFLEEGLKMVVPAKCTTNPFIGLLPKTLHRRIRQKKASLGTAEWGDKSPSQRCNILYGCSHDCVYCYAHALIHRSKQPHDKTWPDEKVNWKAVERTKPSNHNIMFPTSHDLTPANLGLCIQVLNKIVPQNKRVVIVTKAHLLCIKTLCTVFEKYKSKIEFRFTIGSTHQNVLDFWELNAPPYFERLESLIYAHSQGFDCSVSVEPMLDTDPINIAHLLTAIEPYVNVIWLGRMNPRFKVPATHQVEYKKLRSKSLQNIKWIMDAVK